MSTFRPRSLTLIAAAAAAALTLSACSTDSDDAADDTAAPEITSTESPTPDTQTSAVTATDTTTLSSVSSTTSSTRATESTSTSSSAKSRDENVLGDVRDRFSTLAPPEFFDQFDSCVAGGLSGSFDCSGDGIGQFQFFDSDSKAASTTQLLTELRSSRVVEDNGDRVVGWSTLGTSAIITVVDNREGQVMQQLISTDQEDPRQRIYDLGLAEQ
ncbi:hypothetical protein Q0N48_08450 [Corynebacterium ureicelerivorans]|uniref:hypothetical protein n=1 Tax=Corynebacterium ureicelerivorans TaxID=401472 RepID=UPI00264A604A|nr:hypothetical protein [Corynebacterium ureicelerivorans]MDN8606021.1 hypothetical protein [Corynebacterium ureicelerivorans]